MEKKYFYSSPDKLLNLVSLKHHFNLGIKDIQFETVRQTSSAIYTMGIEREVIPGRHWIQGEGFFPDYHDGILPFDWILHQVDNFPDTVFDIECTTPEDVFANKINWKITNVLIDERQRSSSLRFFFQGNEYITYPIRSEIRRERISWDLFDLMKDFK